MQQTQLYILLSPSLTHTANGQPLSSSHTTSSTCCCSTKTAANTSSLLVPCRSMNSLPLPLLFLYASTRKESPHFFLPPPDGRLLLSSSLPHTSTREAVLILFLSTSMGAPFSSLPFSPSPSKQSASVIRTEFILLFSFPRTQQGFGRDHCCCSFSVTGVMIIAAAIEATPISSNASRLSCHIMSSSPPFLYSMW